jgi:hypothetical protein
MRNKGEYFYFIDGCSLKGGPMICPKEEISCNLCKRKKRLEEAANQN